MGLLIQYHAFVFSNYQFLGRVLTSQIAKHSEKTWYTSIVARAFRSMGISPLTLEHESAPNRDEKRLTSHPTVGVQQKVPEVLA